MSIDRDFRILNSSALTTFAVLMPTPGSTGADPCH